ncbi:ABC transporter, substrate-binding protein, family 3 domain protein, partial [Bacteriovorax sp. BSW11_IV]|uniref:substrate-binding periplasmic protein n=1 Tax=Bacteriovorax sp. BSW11_IV TaxID=1353529 RepID=UPI000389EC23
MLKNLIYTLCILLAVIQSSYGRVIKIASLEWPPFTCVSCPESGITIPIIKSILEENGDTLVTHFVPWSRAIKMVNEGKSDLLWPAWASDVFGATLELTVPMFQSPLIVAVRKDSNLEIKRIEDLLTIKVGVVQDYGYYPELLKLIKSNSTKFETVTKD